MADLLYGHDDLIAQWVADHIPYVSEFGPCAAIGVMSHDLICGVVYHDYQPDFDTIQLSIAAINPMWARRETIAALLSYPFDQLGVFKAWISIPMDNGMCLKTTDHIGFKREGVLAHHYGKGRHAVISRMLEPDYQRLYGVTSGKTEPKHARAA